MDSVRPSGRHPRECPRQGYCSSLDCTRRTGRSRLRIRRLGVRIPPSALHIVLVRRCVHLRAALRDGFRRVPGGVLAHQLLTVALVTGMWRGEIPACGGSTSTSRWVASRCSHAVLVCDRAEPSRPKTPRSRRVLALDPRTTRGLTRHRQHQDAERTRLAEIWIEPGYVFVREDGAPLDPHRISPPLQPHRRRGKPPQDPPARPAAHRRVAGDGDGCPSEGRVGAARPCVGCVHARRLQPPGPRHAGRSGLPDCRSRGRASASTVTAHVGDITRPDLVRCAQVEVTATRSGAGAAPWSGVVVLKLRRGGSLTQPWVRMIRATRVRLASGSATRQ